jgi:hypothetical protein
MSTPPKPDDIQVIVKIGAEGGSLTMQGVSDDNDRWRFRLVRSEMNLLEEEEFSPEELYNESEWITSWDDALAQLDTYRSWPQLFPLSVHPLFASRILAAVQARLSPKNDRRVREKLREWKRLCAGGPSHE